MTLRFHAGQTIVDLDNLTQQHVEPVSILPSKLVSRAFVSLTRTFKSLMLELFINIPINAVISVARWQVRRRE